MSVVPRGMNIQEAYQLYRKGNLLVNRRYQRKLVWTIDDKERLVDSIMRGYPIPLILLAERTKVYGSGKYEIIDGMQRFNAIFAFIENEFQHNGKYFDVSQNPRAKQLAEQGFFQLAPADAPLLSPEECAEYLEYQLAVTIYPTDDENETTNVFGRINSSGKQLSDQERRQAGITTPFADIVRKVAIELRGDVSEEIVLLTNMPQISIGSKRSSPIYGIKAADTVWCKQGIISVPQLRDSEDEQIIADLAASILFGEPFAVSTEEMDKLYNKDHKLSKDLDKAISRYGPERLGANIRHTFAVLRETIEAVNNKDNYLRQIVRGKSNNNNPIKTPFYAIFMAFFALLVVEEKSPADPYKIMKSLENLSEKLTASAHYTRTEDRKKNIAMTKGLIQEFFAKKEPPALSHGSGLAIDIENSLLRSRVESPRYELKQGLLKLSSDRSLDEEIIPKIIKTICGMANLGPHSTGYLFIGVADSEKDAKRIESLDNITALDIHERFVVGIDREAQLLQISLDHYLDRLVSAIKISQLTEPLKTQVLGQVDAVKLKDKTIIRFIIPKQKEVSFVGEHAFTREGSSTVQVSGPKLLALFELFR